MGKKRAATPPPPPRPPAPFERILVKDIPKRLLREIPKKTANNVIFESPLEKTEPYSRH